MNWLKLILIAGGLFLAAVIAFSVIGIIYSVVFYLFLLGVLALGAAAGYKLLKKDPAPARLEDKTPVAVAGLKDVDRTLEEYKRKYLKE